MPKWGTLLCSYSHIFFCSYFLNIQSYLYLLNLFIPISPEDLYSQTQKLSLITRCLTWNIYKHRKIGAGTDPKAVEPVLTSHQQSISPSHYWNSFLTSPPGSKTTSSCRPCRNPIENQVSPQVTSQYPCVPTWLISHLR